jgi:hypothetical protein
MGALASRMQSWNWSFRSVAGVLLEMPVDKPHGAVAGVAGAHRFMPQGQQPGAAAHGAARMVGNSRWGQAYNLNFGTFRQRQEENSLACGTGLKSRMRPATNFVHCPRTTGARPAWIQCTTALPGMKDCIPRPYRQTVHHTARRQAPVGFSPSVNADARRSSRRAEIFHPCPKDILAQRYMERKNRAMRAHGRSLHTSSAFEGIPPRAAQ